MKAVQSSGSRAVHLNSNGVHGSQIPFAMAHMEFQEENPSRICNVGGYVTYSVTGPTGQTDTQWDVD